MRLLGMYEWLAGSLADFRKPFQNNEALFNNAKNFWDNLDSISLSFVIVFVLIGGLSAWYYYGPYNNEPGRHYKPKYWWILLLFVVLMTLSITFLVEYTIVSPNLAGARMLEFKIALANAVYGGVFYTIVSFIWCNALPTNAYRYLKI